MMMMFITIIARNLWAVFFFTFAPIRLLMLGWAIILFLAWTDHGGASVCDLAYLAWYFTLSCVSTRAQGERRPLCSCGCPPCTRADSIIVLQAIPVAVGPPAATTCSRSLPWSSDSRGKQAFAGRPRPPRTRRRHSRVRRICRVPSCVVRSQCRHARALD